MLVAIFPHIHQNLGILSLKDFDSLIGDVFLFGFSLSL